MPRPFRFALQAMDLADHDRIVATARRAEALGYDELWSYDHVGTVDPFVPLVVAAEATTTLRVGPLVVNNELHHPVLLARTAATVDRLSGGRLVLGMGTGYMQSEHDATGIELRAPGRRVDRLAESLAALRSLLDTGACVLDGEHHRLAVERLGVTPVQARVPILLGGHGRRVVGLGGRYADVFQFTGLTHGEGGQPTPGGFALADVAERARWLSEATARAGRAAEDVERSLLIQVGHVGADAGPFLAETATQFGVDVAFLEETPFVLAGSVEQIVDKLSRLRERLGTSHVVVRDVEAFAPVVAALRGR
jgi:probable F420-dependent oxidoreductase